MSPGTTEREASPGRILRSLNVPEDWRVSGLWTHPEAVSLRLKEVCREESRIFAGEEAV